MLEHIKSRSMGMLDGHPVTLQRRLGEGAGKAVFAADIHLPGKDQVQHYALAVNGEPGEDPSFCRESEILADANIKGAVIPLGPFEFKDQDGTTYSASISERIRGMSLSNFIQTHEGMPTPGETAGIMAQVARTLHSAHKDGFCHLDVKPSNIMRDVDGVCHMIDWETVAKRGEILAESVGTPYFVSPEMASLQQVTVDPKMDVYSAGITLENIANRGVVPRWDAQLDLAQTPDVIAAYGQIAANRTPRSTRDPLLDQTLKRATHHDPAKRGTALDMMTDLAAFPEARKAYDAEDRADVIDNLMARTKDLQRRQPVLDAAAARGLLEDLSPDHPRRAHLQAISKLASPPKTLDPQPAPARNSADQATAIVDLNQPSRGLKR